MTQTAQERKEFLKRQIDCITQYVYDYLDSVLHTCLETAKETEVTK